VDALPADTMLVERLALVSQAVQVSRQHGVNYIGTEHLLLALASQPASALAACGASVDRLREALSAAEAECQRTHPPIARRVGAWCRLVLNWFRR
jgi:ATP-dependent Clp protease ATP-binding subunit ClpA